MGIATHSRLTWLLTPARPRMPCVPSGGFIADALDEVGAGARAHARGPAPRGRPLATGSRRHDGRRCAVTGCVQGRHEPRGLPGCGAQSEMPVRVTALD